jgi:hypothetical protein
MATSGNYKTAAKRTGRGTNNPWWEVDLKLEVPIESIVVYNRTDGNFGRRLNASRSRCWTIAAWARRRTCQRRRQVAFEVGGEAPGRAVRRAAMTALTSSAAREADTFSRWRSSGDDAGRPAASAAICVSGEVAEGPGETHA